MTTDTGGAAATAHPDGADPDSERQTEPAPPAAPRRAGGHTHHGVTTDDPYAWLADTDDPATLAYLTAENDYTDAMTASQAGLRDTIFAEIKGRTQETDLSVGVRKGDWWYYTRTVEGSQYPLHCRRPARPGETAPPGGTSPAGAAGPPADETILLDGNLAAGDSPFFALGAFTVSPDGNLLAFSVDTTGDERFTLRVKDLRTGETLPDEITDTFYGCAWSRDATALLYVTVDHAWRPYRVWRHTIGSPVSADELLLEEPDDRFRVGVALTRSERYLVLSSASATTSQVWLADAGDPAAAPRTVLPRRAGVEYHVEHQDGADGGRLLILHNDGGRNFALAVAAPRPGASDADTLLRPEELTPVIPHRDDTRLLDLDAFAEHVVVYFRRDGLTGLRILRPDGQSTDIGFPEPLYQVSPGANPEYATRLFRLHYASLATPDSVYDADLATGELTLRKRKQVLSLPGEAAYDPGRYEQVRAWATASDGTQIPLSLIRRRDIPADGTAPLLLYGYGSYEHSVDPAFSIARLSLLERGFVFAIAHVRGGGELGRQWYEDGKLDRKVNTFTDFVACARHLAAAGWTAPERIIARGGSAGGLLMGAVANLAPGAFGGIVAQVPFVDPLTSILDPSLPLTVPEWEEWGDPLHDPAAFAYIRSYSPYHNVTSHTYPPILAVTSLHDTRVLYHEPAKWIARLRATGHGGPFLLRTELNAGHGGRSGRYDAWREESMVLAWIVATAGATAPPAPPAGSPPAAART